MRYQSIEVKIINSNMYIEVIIKKKAVLFCVLVVLTSYTLFISWFSAAEKYCEGIKTFTSKIVQNRTNPTIPEH